MGPRQEVLDAAVVLVKQAYAECSDHGMLARALLRAPLHRVRVYCHLVPGTPVAPMLAKPTKVVFHSGRPCHALPNGVVQPQRGAEAAELMRHACLSRVWTRY
jgi:hypothetical protein